MKKFGYFLLALVLIGLGLFIFGPREPVDTKITFDANIIGNDPEAYLAASEAKITDIRPGLEKEIVWAFPASKAKTPLAIVYIHGFSASKGEIRPVPDRVAKNLNANLYFARLKGHGQSPEAMATPTVNDWFNDVAEALAIGRMIGERVILIGTSTGASPITWGLASGNFTPDVAGTILVSPNYGVQAAGSEILTAPFGRQLANIIIGKERSFEPENELHATWWTPQYPTSALMPMAAITKLGHEQFVENIQVPALFIYAETDRVIRPDLVKDIANRWGGISEQHIVVGADDPYQHVLAGDALSPNKTQEAVDVMTAFIQKITN